MKYARRVWICGAFVASLLSAAPHQRPLLEDGDELVVVARVLGVVPQPDPNEFQARAVLEAT
jgi:hypothetical protein